MRFPSDRLAAFTVSFGAAPVDSWSVAGTKRSIHLQPGFDYEKPIEITAKFDGREHNCEASRHDQFGAEIRYFWECLPENREPEPDGHEGLADVRIVEELLESIRREAPVHMTPTPIRSAPSRIRRWS